MHSAHSTSPSVHLKRAYLHPQPVQQSKVEVSKRGVEGEGRPLEARQQFPQCQRQRELQRRGRRSHKCGSGFTPKMKPHRTASHPTPPSPGTLIPAPPPLTPGRK